VAVQGIVIGILPCLIYGKLALLPIVIAAFTIAVKGIIFPLLLGWSLKTAQVEREVEPLVSYPFSIIISVLIFALSFWLSFHLSLPESFCVSLLVPVAFSTIMTGLFVIVSRVKALTQVLGYLVMENGIYAFGAALLREQPLLVELGVLLDMFVAVFVMGIAIFHISREFDHIDTHILDNLSDRIPADIRTTEET
jgi:hydrogenase-4 component E